MKKIFLLLLSAIIYLFSFSQTRISEMTTTANPVGAYLPVIRAGVNYKLLTDSLFFKKVDSIRIRDGSLYYYKYGGVEYYAGEVGGSSLSYPSTVKKYLNGYGNFVSLNSDSLTEGSTNLFWTNARFDTRFDTRLALKTTSNLTEGSNLYYTNSRARGSISMTNTGFSGNAAYDNSTGVINIPNYGYSGGGIVYKGTVSYTIHDSVSHIICTGNTAITFPDPATYRGRVITIWHSALSGTPSGGAVSFAGSFRPYEGNDSSSAVSSQVNNTFAVYASSGDKWRRIYASQQNYTYDVTSGGTSIVATSGVVWSEGAHTTNRIKGLKAGTGISLSSDASDVTITATGGGGGTWGSITGTLASQTDLQTALNAKEASFTELAEEFTSSTSMSITLAHTPKSGKAEMYYLNGIVIQVSNVSRTGTGVTLSGFVREESDIITAKYSY
jgi:hypothetical protein